MGFTTCRMVSIPPPLNDAAWRAQPSGSDVWADALVRHVWSAPELHRGGGYYCVHIAADALCLSLDGSMGPGGQKQEANNRPPGEEKEG